LRKPMHAHELCAPRPSLSTGSDARYRAMERLKASVAQT
jgi:hypothetical protein